MRGILLALTVFALSSLEAQEGIDFFHGSWEEALQLAKEEQKPIFVDAFAVWCGPCKRMAKNVFTQKEVGEFYNQNFINVKMDMEHGEGPEFARSFPVRAYPTLMFINPQGEKFHDHVGGLSTEAFLKLGDMAIRKYGGSSQFVDLYKEGDRSFETVEGYLKGLARAGQPTLKITNEYLQAKGDELSDAQRASIIFHGVSEADSKLFEEMQTKKRDYYNAFGLKEVQEKALKCCEATVQKAINFKYDPLIEEAFVKLAAFHDYASFAEAFKERSYLQYYLIHSDWLAYEKHLDAYLKTDEAKEIPVQRKLAGEIVQNFGEDAYPKAIDLWEKVAKQDKEDAEAFFMLAQLYQALGKDRKAKKNIEQAIALAKEKSFDDGRYQAFLRKLL
jgi:thioredoxin-related protein